MKTTDCFDKNGKEIFERNKLFGKTFDGTDAVFTVRWSDYRNNWIGDNQDEIYDVSKSIFNQYEIVD